MPIKRRISKHRDFHVTDKARDIWRSGRAEKICLTSTDSGLICCEKLAAELGLPVFVTMPNIWRLIDELSGLAE
ncbi:hypothetical protein OAL97_01550 [Paracoccaceae bacterium]|nr:hypothetical protein [Paracoccaceae bacterium]